VRHAPTMTSSRGAVAPTTIRAKRMVNRTAATWCSPIPPTRRARSALRPHKADWRDRAPQLCDCGGASPENSRRVAHKGFPRKCSSLFAPGVRNHLKSTELTRAQAASNCIAEAKGNWPSGARRQL
jgi:hypothetical protein